MFKRKSFWASTLLLLVFVGTGCDEGNEFPDGPVGVGDSDPLGSIRGSVTATGTGVGGATVILVPDNSVVTRANGDYVFEDVVAGPHTVALRVPFGFVLVAGEAQVREVEVPRNGSAVVDWRLRADDVVALVD